MVGEIYGTTVDLESYIISGTTDPVDDVTQGNLGQFYKNTTTGTFFKCTESVPASGTYTWKKSMASLWYA